MQFLWFPLTILLGLSMLLPLPGHASDLLRFDFNGDNPWPDATADVMPSTPIDLLTTFEVQPVGVATAAKPTESTGGLLLQAEVGKVGLPWSAIFMSGLLPVTTRETDLSRLKVGMGLAASAAQPIKLQLASYDVKKQLIGELQTIVTPKHVDVFEPVELKLSSFQSITGKFSAEGAFVQFTFTIAAPDWTDSAVHRVRIDDLTYETVSAD